MTAGRKQTVDGKYARKMFPEMIPHLSLRKIKRAGGAKKLKSLPAATRRLLLGTSR
jgi:hypothetical protein